MKRNRNITLILATIGAYGFVPNAIAAVSITAMPLAREADSTGSEILADGELVAAYHFGNSPIGITVAGIPFLAGNSGTGSAFAETGLSGSSNGMYGWLTGQLGYAFTDASYDQLVNQSYVGGSPVITFGELVIGQAYRLQIILQETRGTPSIEGVEGPALVFGNTGVVTATWVAADEELNVSWASGASPHFSAFALHAVPEPSVALLAGFGLLGFVGLRRRCLAGKG